jgi:hypothetical protein
MYSGRSGKDEVSGFDDEIVFEDDYQQQFVSERTLLSKEDISRTSGISDSCGTMATTAEGEFGKKLRKANLLSRTPEQKFCDNVIRICAEIGINIISYAERDNILKLHSILTDIRFKSPAAVIFGFKAMNYVKDKPTEEDKKQFNRIIQILETIPPQSVQKINKLDVIRYARYLRKIKNLD